MGITYDREKELPAEMAAQLRPEIQAFVQQYQKVPSWLMTFRKDGRPVMRPVSTFVEGWTVQTITQDIQPKTKHIRNNSTVAYLWVDNQPHHNNRLMVPKNVFLEGTAELIEDDEVVQEFFARRLRIHNHGDAHPGDPDFRRILMKVTPRYLRAEGWVEGSAPVIIRDFSY